MFLYLSNIRMERSLWTGFGQLFIIMVKDRVKLPRVQSILYRLISKPLHGLRRSRRCLRAAGNNETAAVSWLQATVAN